MYKKTLGLSLLSCGIGIYLSYFLVGITHILGIVFIVLGFFLLNND